MNELLKLTAFEITQLLSKREVSPIDLVEICAERIEQVDSAINALPTLSLEYARDRAIELTRKKHMVQNHSRGWLGGLPISIKDLIETKGIRTTFGSQIYSNYVPTQSDVLVDNLESRGGIVVGKSNTPEFGAGASTFNEVFGTTKNPWNTEKSVAGSSGGACASVATGEAWLATGSDLGGSLRTPASFNSVVGLRPSPGRVPYRQKHEPFSCLHVQGPIARNCRDAALFLDAMAGLHRSDPLSIPAPANSFQSCTENPAPPLRVGYSSDLGITHVDSEVESICRNAVLNFEDIGTDIEEKSPNFRGSIESFNVLRAASFATNLQNEYKKHRNLLKPEIVWNIEQGLKLTAEQIGTATRNQAKIYRSVVRFFEKYDLLICPCAIVPPFDAGLRYVESVGEHVFDTYFEWIAITFVLTLTTCPVLALPAGFTKNGLPVGIQIVGPPRDEAAVLAAGHLLEEMLAIHKQLPIDPRTP